jgi:hypothetical protein
MSLSTLRRISSRHVGQARRTRRATYRLWSSGRGLKGATACVASALRAEETWRGCTGAYGHVCDSLWGEGGTAAAAACWRGRGRRGRGAAGRPTCLQLEKVGRRKVSQSSGGCGGACALHVRSPPRGRGITSPSSVVCRLLRPWCSHSP